MAASARYRREGNVAADLALLLGEIGIDSADIEREHPSGKGRIDLYIPRYRTIIETKARGKAADLDKAQATLGESPREQMERYMAAEIATERARPLLFDEIPSERRWTGIVTDGRHWHAFSYTHMPNPLVSRQTLHSGRVSGAEELAANLLEWLSGDPVGQPWIPADPTHLFKDRADELAHLYRGLPKALRRSTETKRALWHDMLRVSGLSPLGQAAPDRLFRHPLFPNRPCTDGDALGHSPDRQMETGPARGVRVMDS